MKDLSQHLDRPEYRGTFLQSLLVLMKTMLSMLACWYGAKYAMSQLEDRVHAVHCTFVILWALLVVRSFVIFHDCGHGSFFQGFTGARTINWMTLHVSAIMCGTPTDWNVGHQLHHANVGNTTQSEYDWGETVFHTATEFMKLTPRKQLFWRVARHPIPFFTLAPFLTWYVKMRLPFEFRPGRKAAYRCSDKAVSTFCMMCRYVLAYNHDILSIIFVGDYLAMIVGVLLFHTQHVYDPGYVRPAHAWKLRDAAMHGSSFSVIPTWLKCFTLGIEYHHIHHFRTRIPGYMLQTVHNDATPEMWKEVVELNSSALYRSLWLQVYDDVEGKYSTFEQVLRSHSKVKYI